MAGNSTPLVSVIMPVYNAKRYVLAAVDSILGQSFADLELIIVDDCSTDGSWELVSKIRDPRVKVLRQASNMGYPHAMNLGIEAAKGRFIARMDADDVSHPDRIETEVNFLEDHPDVAFVGTTSYWLTPGGKALKRWDPRFNVDSEWVVETWDTVMNGTRMYTDPTVVALKDDICSVGRYRTYSRTGQDVDLWLRLLEAKPQAVTIMRPLYGRRLVPEMITFAVGTRERNKVVRLLAEERKRTGSDAVMRGELVSVSLDSNPTSDEWLLSALVEAEMICAFVGDLYGCLEFARKSLKVGGCRALSPLLIARKIHKLLLVRKSGRLERVRS